MIATSLCVIFLPRSKIQSFKRSARSASVVVSNLFQRPGLNCSCIADNVAQNPGKLIISNSGKFFFFSFRPFPLVRGGHSVSSFSTSFCLQHPSPSHQLPAYLPLLHLKIFSLVSLFSSFPVTPFPSFFFQHTLGLSS